MLQDAVGATTAVEGLVKDTTTQSFVKDVIEESKRQPVLVDFWAPWCGPCKQLTPVLEKVVKAAKGKVRLVKMNIDEHPQIPGQMGIQSIPAVIAFVKGQPADGFMGALPESQVIAFIERLTKERIGGEAKDLLKAADAALAEANPAGAAEVYAQILAEEPENIPALAGLARSYVATGHVEQAKQTLAMVPEAKRNEAPVTAARAAIEVAEQAKSLGPIAELEKKVAANPLDHQARFDLALALNAKSKRQEAVDHLLEIVRARPQMERGRRAQAARSVLRGLGPDRRGHRRRPAPAVVDLVRVDHSRSGRGFGTWSATMPMNAVYRGASDLAQVIPVFPLPGALLLPRGQMPLNIFEPRYLAMVDDALRDGHRLIGMIQPDAAHPGPDDKPNLYKVGCVGRITQLAETGDGRYLMQLTGVARFRVEEELKVATDYRQCRVSYAPFADDFVARRGEEAVDREALLRALSDFLKANDLKADWEGIENAPNEALVNALAMMSPYGSAEKQAMLEAPDLKTRAEILVAATEIELAKTNTPGETPLQ